MAERGSIGGLDFRFNQQAVAPPQQQMYAQPVAPIEADVPDYSDDLLAVREKLTSDYYSNMGLLRSFANDMAKQGIDVFSPDWSQEDGGLAFQTAEKLKAGVMYAANALKGEFQQEKQVNDAVLRGDARRRSDFDPRTQLYSQTPDAAYSTQLDPRIVAANQRTGQNVYTQRDAANLNQQVYDPTQAAIQGDPNMSAEERAYQQGGLFPSVAETSYQQLIPRSGGSGLRQEDFTGRAELIKRMKMGVVTGDPTVINTLKLVPGVEDVEYVNTGDKVGIQVYLKGQGQPSFIDASKGEGEINAMLNRIEGQKNIPNEAVANFDTRVNIPQSNARQVLDDVKAKLSALPDSPETVKEIFPKIQELAAQGGLMLPTGEPIVSVDLDIARFWGTNDLVVKYYRIRNGKVDYSKTVEKIITNPDEIKNLVDVNANQIAPAFGGGFVDPNAPTTAPSIDPDI